MCMFLGATILLFLLTNGKLAVRYIFHVTKSCSVYLFVFFSWTIFCVPFFIPNRRYNTAAYQVCLSATMIVIDDIYACCTFLPQVTKIRRR